MHARDILLIVPSALVTAGDARGGGKATVDAGRKRWRRSDEEMG
jgi:hypothetical protein